MNPSQLKLAAPKARRSYILLVIVFLFSHSLNAGDTRPRLPDASISNQCLALFPLLARQKSNYGGFAVGMTPEEMADIARSLSTDQHIIAPIPGKSFEQVMINASYRKPFWEKIGVVIRDIAGSHLLNDANHRMAFIVTKRLIERNGIIRNPSNSDERIADIISKAARKVSGFTTPEDIAKELRGY